MSFSRACNLPFNIMNKNVVLAEPMCGACLTPPLILQNIEISPLKTKVYYKENRIDNVLTYIHNVYKSSFFFIHFWPRGLQPRKCVWIWIQTRYRKKIDWVKRKLLSFRYEKGLLYVTFLSAFPVRRKKFAITPVWVSVCPWRCGKI